MFDGENIIVLVDENGLNAVTYYLVRNDKTSFVMMKHAARCDWFAKNAVV